MCRLPPFRLQAIPSWETVCYIDSCHPPPPGTDPHLFNRTPSGQWQTLTVETQALILASTHVQLPSITLDNTHEWLYRLWLLSDLGIYFLDYPAPNGDGPVPLPILPTTILSHIGLSFPSITNPLPPASFDSWARSVRLSRISTDFPEVPCPPPSPSLHPIPPISP